MPRPASRPLKSPDDRWLRLECLKLASDRTMKLSLANDNDALISLARHFYAYVEKG